MKEIMDLSMMQRSIKRMAHEILERNKGVDNLVILGIKTRGEFLAERLAKIIASIEECHVDFGTIDIKYWRDDIDFTFDEIPNIDVELKDKTVILVDDVLYKGRTVRAAMDGVMYYGRAKSIHLAVLIDRGHREVPIRADYVGKNVPTSENENVKVQVVEIDGSDGVYIL